MYEYGDLYKIVSRHKEHDHIKAFFPYKEPLIKSIFLDFPLDNVLGIYLGNSFEKNSTSMFHQLYCPSLKPNIIWIIANYHCLEAV